MFHAKYLTFFWLRFGYLIYWYIESMPAIDFGKFCRILLQHFQMLTLFSLKISIFLWYFVVHFFVPQFFNLRSELAATRKWGGDHLRRAAAFKSSGRSSFLTPTWLEASQVFGKSGFEFEEAGQVTCSRLPPADNGACPGLQQEALCLPAPPYF